MPGDAQVDAARCLFERHLGDWSRRHGPPPLPVQHVDPKEAVQIHQDVCSRRSLAIHWGTFPLTDEPMDEPPGVLREELEGAKLAPEEFVSLRHGASIVTAGGVDAGKPAVFTG